METYDDEDTLRMVKTIQATPKPCLGFKILAAGKKAGTPEERRNAFEFAFTNIKPIDGVVVGMFPKHSPQVAGNAALVREFVAR